MKKFLTLFLMSCLFGVSVNAQGTLLAPGDIALVQYQSDTPDAFAFVTFVDLVAGTTIYFTDCGATPGTGTFLNPCNEGAKKYIVGPSGATAGDMFFFEDGGGDPLFTTHTDAGILGSFALGTTGDQILVFQDTDGTGGTDPTLNPTFLFAINGASTGWTGDPSTSSSHTSLPTGLVDGTTAIAVGAGSGPSDEVDNSVFNTLGMPFASVAAAKAAILNTANWYPAGDDSEVTYAGYVAALIAQGNLLGSAIVCPTVGAVSASESSVCVNDPFNITATGLVTMDGTSNMEQDFGIEFKFFGSATADPYTGGTSLGTVPFGSLTGGNTTAALVGASIPFVDPTGFIYAVLSPTPTDGTCRPSAVTTIASQSAPSIDVTLPETYCLDDGIVTSAGPLVAPTAASTVFSGANVTDNGDNSSFTFDVPTAGAGVHPVTVTLTNANNCTTVVMVNVTVIETTATFTAPADLCVNAGVQANLGGGTPVQGTVTGDMGMYSGPGVSDNGNGMTYNFDPATAGVGTHTLFYAYTDENGCTGTGSDMVQVFASPTVTFTAPADACVNDIPVTALNGGGSPAGGVYSGPGVTDSGDGMGFTFDPGSAEVGVHTITYTVGAAGCSGSAMDDIEVFGLPTTTMTVSDDFCEDAGVQTSLSGGTPTGGIYSGTAVTDDANGMTYTFDPATAGAGVHTVFYNFTDTNGCTGSGSDLVEVFALPVIDFTALPDLCLNDGVQVGQGGGTPFGGVYMGPGVTDDVNGFTYEFDPAVAGVGVHTLSYQFTDAGGCTGTGTDMVEVFDIPNAMFTAPADLCISAGVQIGLGGGTPVGGMYMGAGVSDDGNGSTYTFDPAAAGVGVITITYSVGIAGCSDAAMDDIEVYDLPTIVFSAPDDLCIDAGELVDIGGATPMGGVYMGPGVSDDANGMTYDFDPATAGVGTHILVYTFTDANGCTGSGSDLVEVFALPTVMFTAPADLCVDAGVQAGLGGGTPAPGGVYMGPGVTDNGDGTYDFDPAAAGVGTHTIDYNFTDPNGCSGSGSDMVEVFDLPTVMFTAPAPTVCVDDAPVPNLGGGTPIGGVYSGLGVTDDGNGETFTFNPSASAPAGGNIPVTYTFTDANGCANSATDDIFVNPICCMLMVTCPTGPVALECVEEVPALADAAAILAEFTAQGGVIDESCNPVVITFADADDGAAGCIGAARTVTRTFTVTDAGTGESEDCPIDYVIMDTTPPTITCPADVTVGCTASTDTMDTGSATATDNCTGGATPVAIWINEFHYDNASTDVDEFVEVAGTAGFDLSTCDIVLYNGNGGASYNTVSLSGMIDDEGMGYGAVSFLISGIQNGAPDGIALVCNGAVIEFISYEGSFMATNGPAMGMTSINVGVSETSGTPAGQSLQLEGTGSVAADFIWAGPATASAGDLNANQSIVAPPPPAGPVITFTDSSTPDVCAEYVISRTWTATDACGNQAVCTQMITVEAPGAPTITCPADLTVECDASTDPADTGMATGTADCNLGFNITFADVSTQGTTGCSQYEYEITRTWTNTDACGTMAVCTQIITVEDSTPPVITCPANLTVQCDESTDPADTGEATATDNCSTSSGGSPTPVIWINEFHYDNVGTDAGEFVEVAGTAGFDLSSCQIVLYNGNGGASYNTISLSGTIDDESMGYGAVSFLQSGLQNGAPDGLALVCGGTVIEFLSYEGSFMATNGPAAGMTSVNVGLAEGADTPVAFSLQLQGTGSLSADFAWTGPVAESPGTLNTNQIIALPTGPAETVVAFSDVSTQGQGCSAYSYMITRTWTATDACGNQSVCTQIITVEDTTPPVITCPADVTVECDQATDPAATGTASGVDNCAGSSGGDPVVWINEFHYDNTGTDVNEFVEIAGTAAFDLSSCQIVLYNGNGGASYNTIVLSGVIDNESNGFGALSFAQSGIQNGSPDGIALVCAGTVVEFISYEGSFTATDGPAMGMTSTDVGVEETSGTPVGQSLQLGGSGNMAADFAWAGPAAESPGSLNANQIITVSSNGEIVIAFSDVSTQTPTGCSNDSYTITRTWTATDPCGNASMCVQTITVEDTTPPTIICPANTTIECDEDISPANTGEAIALDDCAATAEIVITFVDASTQGTTGCAQYQYEITRTWTATDPCGNATNCVQVINVEDTTPPEIVCPADVTLSCTESTDPGDTGTATGSDNCSAVAEVIITSSDISTQGTEGCSKFTYNILRTWLATDACGNTTTCVQSIDVADTEPPVVTCPPSQTFTCFETVPTPAMNAADFIALGGTISDNCTSLLTDFTVFSQDDDNGGDNCPGNARTVVRTYFIQDACGNTASCEQSFTYLESTQGPVITSILPTCFKYCSSLTNPMETDITYETDCSFGATVNVTGPTQIGQDDCPGTIYRYTYTVTDDCGRTSAPVTRDFVIQNDGPTIECPAFNLLLECGDPNNSDYIAAHAGLVTANSSCGSDVTISQFPTNFNNITCNTSTTVTFTATDACGRTATCTTIVNISDNTAPVITSVYEDGICNEAVCGSDLNFWYNNWRNKVMEGLSATDACDTNVSIAPQGPNTPNQNCPDETTETVVNFVATDNCGNTSYIPYSFYVTALETPEPPETSTITGMIHTEEMEAVENVEVYLSGGASFFEMFVTANDGNYSFTDVPLEQNYSITPLLNEFPMNGVSSFDLVLIAQHILSINELDSPYKMIAADINRSGSITTLDLVELRKMILYINTEFPNNTSWRFVDADFVFPYVDNPFATAFPEIVDINALLEAAQHDFVGVKIGDVNGTAVANNLSGGDDRSFNGDLPFNVNDIMMEAGETYEVAFSSDAFEAIAGYQYTLNFNTDMLEFVNVNAGELAGMSEANFGLSLLDEGAITTSWTNNAPISMRADEDLFRISFKAKRAIQLSEALSVNSRYTKAEAYDVNTENGQLNLLNVGLRFEDALSTKFTLMQNTPNPFSDETVIGFILPEATAATMTVHDVSGRMLKSISGDYEAGYNEVSLDRSDLKPGMMYYTLTTSDRTLTKRMLLVNKN